MLEVKSLKKNYGDFSVSLDFAVNAGETLALVGPSGSGKTTALNLIAGLAEPDSGSVVVDGEDITNLPPWKRNISVVFQDLALFPHLDVGGNIAYGLFIHGVKRKERRLAVEKTLDLVRLSGYASRRIDTLSGGERQRVAIARALASSPKALLLDEPFSSLDAPLRKNMRREFLEIRSSSKIPCIFVTHDQEEAVMLGDKVALMSEGRIVETGVGRDLLLSPKTETAAKFFGAGQVIPCKILNEAKNGIEVSSPLGILTVPHETDSVKSVYSSNASKLFIPEDACRLQDACRPKDGFMFEGKNTLEQKSFSAKCTGSLFEGKSLVIKLQLDPWGDGQSPPLPFELGAGKRAKAPAPGSTVTVWLDESLIRFVE